MSGAPKVLFHYTNPVALIDIINQNKLKGNLYDHRVTDIYGGKGKYEIATVRPSRANTINKSYLSENVSGIKIIIKLDVLNDKVKGVKAKPIAEYPVSYLKELIALLMDAFNQPYRGMFYKKNYEKKARDLIKYIQINTKKEVSVRELIKEWLKKQGINTEDLIPGLLSDLESEYNSFRHATKNREGEERIVIKRDTGIPLDKSYLKIEFTPEMLDIIRQYKKNHLNEILNQLFRTIKKRPELFVQNKIFTKVLFLLRQPKEFDKKQKSK